MIRSSGLRTTSIVIVIFVGILVAVFGIGVYIHGHPKKTVPKPEYPEYLNFDGNYVFSVPKNYTVDEQSVQGAQLIFSGQITAKTLEDVYNQNGISAAGISDLTDHSSRGFKNYVNNNFLPNLKKDASTSNVQVKFVKTNGWDVARLTVTKDGQQFRFIYLKSGQHPVVVVAKQETDPLKKIEQTLVDVEVGDLKNESDLIKQSIKSYVQLAKDQKTQDLYNAATSELRAKSTQAELAAALNGAASYLNENITVSGGTYDSSVFSATLRFTSLNKDNQQSTLGAILLKKVDGQWKLQALSLPSPASAPSTPTAPTTSKKS